MKNVIAKMVISTLLTSVVVIGNWYWCVLIEHWNPSGMSLDWFRVGIMATINYGLISMYSWACRRAKSKQYITMKL